MRLLARIRKRCHFETATKVNAQVVCITKPSPVAAPFVCSSLPVSLFSAAVCIWRQTMKIFSVFHSPELQLSERINIYNIHLIAGENPMAFFQWFRVMLSMSTLFAYCYIQNVTATFDMFFCWHLFSLLFYVNKVLWDPGILLLPLLYTVQSLPKVKWPLREWKNRFDMQTW